MRNRDRRRKRKKHTHKHTHTQLSQCYCQVKRHGICELKFIDCNLLYGKYGKESVSMSCFQTTMMNVNAVRPQIRPRMYLWYFPSLLQLYEYAMHVSSTSSALLSITKEHIIGNEMKEKKQQQQKHTTY